jgi:hypothetical protein
MVKQRNEVGISRFVVNDEAGIDRNRRRLTLNDHGVGVPADAAVLLIDGDPVAMIEEPRRRQPGYSAAYDSDVFPAGSISRHTPSALDGLPSRLIGRPIPLR